MTIPFRVEVYRCVYSPYWQPDDLQKLLERDPAAVRELDRLLQMSLCLFQLLLPDKFHIPARYKAAFAGKRFNKAVALQFFIRALCRNNADAKLLRQQPHGGEAVPLRELAADNQIFNL